jgi:hypothetical protein
MSPKGLFWCGEGDLNPEGLLISRNLLILRCARTNKNAPNEHILVHLWYTASALIRSGQNQISRNCWDLQYFAGEGCHFFENLHAQSTAGFTALNGGCRYATFPCEILLTVYSATRSELHGIHWVTWRASTPSG